MYVVAIKWAMGLVDADVTPHPVSGQYADGQSYELNPGHTLEELGVQ